MGKMEFVYIGERFWTSGDELVQPLLVWVNRGVAVLWLAGD
jgi:hypothetical protein